jgi:hypothetical protein
MGTGTKDGPHPPSFKQSLLVRVPSKQTIYLYFNSICSSVDDQAGAAAGTSVDLLFFPIDTVKTRLQSAQGFLAAGGFRGVYKGLGSVVVGSAPGGAYTLAIFMILYGLK